MKVLYFAALLAVIASSNCANTPEEMAKAMKAAFKTCRSEFLPKNLPAGPLPPPPPQQIKCILNCVMEELGVIKKDQVQAEEFVKRVPGIEDLNQAERVRLMALVTDCENVVNPDKCARGSEIFECLKKAMNTAGLKCDHEEAM